MVYTPFPSIRAGRPPTPSALREAIELHLKYDLAKQPSNATLRDWWYATCLVTRDLMVERRLETFQTQEYHRARRVYYLSMEYLMGRLLLHNLACLGITEECRQALQELGLELERIAEVEREMGLGNGGLGRLASCILDSLATLDYPAVGYGILYQFGLFHQEIVQGYQVERPDEWRELGHPWEISRPELAQKVSLYGELKRSGLPTDPAQWIATTEVVGIPVDILLPGYGTQTVNFLRLWMSRSSRELDLEAFNRGGYFEAVREKTFCESISKVLYPNDKTEAGKELRLVQQYFFVACSLRDILRRFWRENTRWEDFPKKVVIHLNDTHPSLAIVELMRILVDEQELPWDRAWELVSETFSYTNHTLMPEGLEKWPVPLLQKVLPRHLEILYALNHRLMEWAEKRFPGDGDKKTTLSLIEETTPKSVRMANLAVMASRTVNGVSRLHSELLRSRFFAPFAELWPDKFTSVTNGISPRTFLLMANPRLAGLLNRAVGGEWVRDLEKLRGLEELAEDSGFQAAYLAVKEANKVELSNWLLQRGLGSVDPHSLFDVQAKRIHEYKRQHLNLLRIVALYLVLRERPQLNVPPRVFVFAGKAAPGYDVAKRIIKAIHAVAARVNSDPVVKNKLQVLFVPNYSVDVACRLIAAADLSEQISTAGTEASGTGNMKFALNGALTIGTLDGANVEIREEVGEENFFSFGHTVEELQELRRKGYQPKEWYEKDPLLRRAIDWLFSQECLGNESPQALEPLRKALFEEGDRFFVLADFRPYWERQQEVDVAFFNRRRWAKMAILNTARMGRFSSDRVAREYATRLWRLSPLACANQEKR